MSTLSHLRRTAAAVTVTAATLSSVALLAPAASASGGSTAVTASGSCTGATWKLKAKPDDGRLQVELEVDSNRVGQVWAVRITDNGTQVFAGNRTTLAPSGSFTVSIRPANRAGTDTIRATATRGSVTCAGTVSL